ncbi:hypothetical protein CA603_07540 [Paraburkholderia hospita]|nr:hypothetical protein CA603_07540 [Paraburkholderia hospita]
MVFFEDLHVVGPALRVGVQWAQRLTAINRTRIDFGATVFPICTSTIPATFDKDQFSFDTRSYLERVQELFAE